MAAIAGDQPFIAKPDGLGWLYAPAVKDGPLPTHYEPVESPVGNLLYPKQTCNPTVRTFEGPLNLSDYRDEYREGLQKIIDAKIAGEEIVAPADVEAPPKVVNLMEALRKSLDSISASKSKTAASRPASTVATSNRRRSRTA